MMIESKKKIIMPNNSEKECYTVRLMGVRIASQKNEIKGKVVKRHDKKVLRIKQSIM